MSADNKRMERRVSSSRRRLLQSIGIATVVGLAGCASNLGGKSNDQISGDGQSNVKTTLQVAGWGGETEAKLTRKWLDSFESNHKAISTEYNQIPWSQYKQKLQTQLGAGQAPDAFYVDASYYQEFAQSGALLDFTQYMEESAEYDAEEIFDGLKDFWKRDGKWQGIPKDFQVLGLWYNTNLFNQAGITSQPKTWTGFRTALTNLKEKTDVAYPLLQNSSGIATLWLFYPFIEQNGGKIISDDGSECLVASDKGIEALEYLIGMKKDKLIGTPDEVGIDSSYAALGKGAVALGYDGNWIGANLEDKYPKEDEKFDIFTHTPHPSNGEKFELFISAGWTSPTKGDNPEQSWELIKSLTSVDGQKEWAKQGNALPIYESLRNMNYYENHSRRQKLLNATKWMGAWAYGPETGGILNDLSSELSASMLGKKTPQEALETAQSKINNRLK
ncbi:ABC transporter substrate-binding protein [Halocatena marina]|uniref:ABC transporter substrate-binding protein n=1 Tax=Halocatena marina TaxID=2934937 RepID=UPI00200BF467|nr:sugar ABC transporter substrate-binding protein [Halocatena marina]